MRSKQNFTEKQAEGEISSALREKGGSAKQFFLQRTTIFEQRNHEHILFFDCFGMVSC